MLKAADESKYCATVYEKTLASPHSKLYYHNSQGFVYFGTYRHAGFPSSAVYKPHGGATGMINAHSTR